MDSRIEELAEIIRDRSRDFSENARQDARDTYSERRNSYAQLRALADAMLMVIRDYRRDHPEEYGDDEARRLRLMCETYASELLKARQELARYKEREATMGWSQE